MRYRSLRPKKAIGWGLSALAMGLGLMCQTAEAENFWASAQLVDARISGLSQEISSVAHQRSFLSDGSTYSLERYYGSDWKDVRLVFLSPLSEEFGVFWGVGTGERGEKYSIDPSLTLGFLQAWQLDRHSSFAVSLKVVVGGALSETSCTADYGAIGGVQEVNCRLADSFLPPEQTLDFLFDEEPADRFDLSLNYTFRF